jgi:hypothetical protein
MAPPTIAQTSNMELASLERLLFLFTLIPSGYVQKFYAIPYVPWLVAFSIPFLITWSQPRPQRAVYAIPLIVLLNLHIVTPMIYNCDPDGRDGGFLVYSRKKCANSKLVLCTSITISIVVILRRAWR